MIWLKAQKCIANAKVMWKLYLLIAFDKKQWQHIWKLATNREWTIACRYMIYCTCCFAMLIFFLPVSAPLIWFWLSILTFFMCQTLCTPIFFLDFHISSSHSLATPQELYAISTYIVTIQLNSNNRENDKTNIKVTRYICTCRVSQNICICVKVYCKSH